MQLEQSNKNSVMSGCHGYDGGVHRDREVARVHSVREGVRLAVVWGSVGRLSLRVGREEDWGAGLGSSCTWLECRLYLLRHPQHVGEDESRSR